MPYLTIIAKGSIFIEKRVSRLDGLFVALKSKDAAGNDVIGSDTYYKPGTIYTCTNYFNEPLRPDVPVLPGDPPNPDHNFPADRILNVPNPAGGPSAGGCASHLTINGALVAETGVEFWRIQNSLRDSRIGDASTTIGGNNAAAEEINFIPELLLSNPALNGDKSGLDLDSFSGLPPIF